MFSKACKYAIRAVLYLAVHSSPENKVGVKAIAEDLQVPKHFLAKILQQLSRDQLISSVKGPNGGFYMADENLNVPMEKIIKSFDGMEVFTSCILGLPVCSAENPCPLHVQAFAYREGLYYQLQHQSIREMADRVKLQELKL
ncbi:MAG: hypothetical protein DHS20C18_45800 [Saprospiraceae bacterium]|nr:MAG: hypothetical protein DHS20C18_45800 [Saprospiraceae bacterium]